MISSKQETSNPASENPFIEESEMERLRRNVFRTDKEKFLLFTKMLRTNMMYKRAKITHK